MIQRYAGPMLGAVFLTLGLFWIMQAMVFQESSILEDSDSVRLVEFVRLKREEPFDPKRKQRRRPEPPPPEAPKPPTPELNPAENSLPAPGIISVPMPKLDLARVETGVSVTNGVNVGESLGGLAGLPGAGSDSEVIPLVRIPPRYPRQAASRKIEGWVKVQFTIAENGTVRNPRVVGATPKRIFDDAALGAIRKWRFKPRLVEGKPVERPGVTQVIRFALDGLKRS